MGIKYAHDGVPCWDKNPSFFNLSLAFCLEAPTSCVVMVADGRAGGAAIEAIDTASEAGAADWTAAAEVVGVWLF